MIDAHEFKAAMRLFASGITVLTWKGADTPVQGITVSAFSSLSLHPPLVLFCIDQDAYIYPELCEQKTLIINILAEGQTDLAYQFASGDRSQLEEHLSTANNAALPMLKNAQANLVVNIVNRLAQGDHDIFIAEIQESHIYPERGPLLYYNSRIFHKDAAH
ncbi:flavin reductase family protein [Suttonella ornithocola]|uniref:p-hydroxyphenylacetate 3-hydroxylase, reductase component n=1 Tax=Suttonella ornithocola TaxID=279832 RepID=A0A380MN78_9GAMM|nr:flavin reductase family protein [Suttonella ornithocola]SUO93353.1 p-hydroxyphenylacetate 3-hydroxylase, reductase component [Suttonella ornithocola]